jgi:hypothetical protein
VVVEEEAEGKVVEVEVEVEEFFMGTQMFQ